MKRLIIISDWADDTLTCSEVKSAIIGSLVSSKNPDITFISSTPSTIHTGFLIEQTVLTESYHGNPGQLVIFQNTDPRLPDENLFNNPYMGKLLIIRLVNGIIVFGPNAGYDFSLIRDQIDKVYFYPNYEKGGQFRSRDLYARVAAHLIEEKEEEMDFEELSQNPIPELKGFYIAHIDNFGNIKTTIKKSDFKGKYEFGDKIKVKINGITNQLTYAEGLFKYKPNELIIYPGSSGKKDDPYLEISVWRYFTDKKNMATGIFYFKNPLPGEKIEILD
jgi:hypothetical protein